MAKALGFVGTVVGLAASVLPSPLQPFAIAASVALNIGSGLLQKKPPVLGSPNDIRIGSNNPTPCILGRTYTGATMVHDVGYGPTSGGIPNPYRSMVFVGSVGPIEQFESFQVEHAPVAFSGGNAVGYYHNFMYLATKLGATPDTALAGPFGAITGWGASHKLSGKASWLVTLKDDREGKTYSSGVPRLGAIIKGPKVYDPRQDGTYPGGSGPCRALQEATYVGGAAAQNPACHGLTYALGRWQNGKKVFGVGLAVDSIDWPAWVEFANICDANGWAIGGRIEEPGSRWDNLKRICEAGGGKPAWVGGKLTVIFPRPRVALDTIEADDLAEGEGSILDIRGWKDRQNILVPKIRLETHKWEPVQLDPVRVEAFIAADGEEKKQEFPIELVQDKDQAAELAGYELWNRRERGPIVLNCKVRMIEFKVGDALALGTALIEELDPEGMLGLEGMAYPIIGRRLDPATATVELTLETDTAAKHVAVLGSAGGAPPAPAIMTGEEMDAAAAAQRGAWKVLSRDVTWPFTPGDGSITIAAHTGVIEDGRTITFPADTITDLTESVAYGLFWDLVAEDYVAELHPALAGSANRAFVFLGWSTTSSGGTFPPGEPPPPGWGGDGPVNDQPI